MKRDSPFLKALGLECHYQMQFSATSRTLVKERTYSSVEGQYLDISKTIQVRKTRHAGHCWVSKDELISGVLLWTTKYARASVGRPARIYLQLQSTDTGCNLEDLSGAMDERERERERERELERERES